MFRESAIGSASGASRRGRPAARANQTDQASFDSKVVVRAVGLIEDALGHRADSPISVCPTARGNLSADPLHLAPVVPERCGHEFVEWAVESVDVPGHLGLVGSHLGGELGQIGKFFLLHGWVLKFRAGKGIERREGCRARVLPCSEAGPLGKIAYNLGLWVVGPAESRHFVRVALAPSFIA